MRYYMLEDSDDLEQSIVHFTEAIFLPLPWHRPSSNVIQIFFSIARALIIRAKGFRHPEDVTRSIIYLRYLHEQSRQSSEVFEVPLNDVTVFLVRALRIQAEMDLGNVTRDIDSEEMADLCQELLKLDMSTTSVTGPIMNLAKVVVAQFGRLNKRQEPSDKAIECLREASILQEASILLPDSHHVSFALALSLFARFCIGHSNDDYEEAITILDKVARIPGDKLTQIRVLALKLASSFAYIRTIMFQRPEHREQAIHRIRTLLTKLPPEDSFCSSLKSDLTRLQGHRSYGSGAASDLEEAGLENPGVPGHPPFQELTASLTELNADSEDKHFDALLSMDRITDEAELEEAVKYCRLLLASSHHDSAFAHFTGYKLTTLLHRAFLCTNKIKYLNEEISVLRDNFHTQSAVEARAANYFGLLLSLSIRLQLLSRREDFNEIMQLFPMAVNDEHMGAPERFPISCEWALKRSWPALPDTPPPQLRTTPR